MEWEKYQSFNNYWTRLVSIIKSQTTLVESPLAIQISNQKNKHCLNKSQITNICYRFNYYSAWIDKYMTEWLGEIQIWKVLQNETDWMEEWGEKVQKPIRNIMADGVQYGKSM